MKLVFAFVDETDTWHKIDTGLGGEAIRQEGEFESDFVVPFGSRENAVDCLRIILADVQRTESDAHA